MMESLAEFREVVRYDVEQFAQMLGPDEDVFPHLMVPRPDRTGINGRPVMVIAHVGEFFEHGDRGKDIFVRMALPLMIRKLEAERLAFVSPVWYAAIGPDDQPDETERKRLIEITREHGVSGLPEQFRREGVMVRISDGITEISAFADLARHPGAPPSIKWEPEKETAMGDMSQSEGRMHNGFLVKAFALAKSLTPLQIQLGEAVLGLGFWTPNPDDNPEQFRKP